MPARRKFSELDADVSNVTTVWSSNTKALAGVVAAEEPIVAVRWATAAKTGVNFEFRKLTDLKNVVLVMADGTDHSEEFTKHIRAGTKNGLVYLLYGRDYGKRAFNMVLQGRADIYLTGMVPLGFRLKKQGLLDRISITHAPYFPTAHVYPSFSKNNPKARAWAGMMSKGIRDLRSTGRLAEILGAYGLTDWADE